MRRSALYSRASRPANRAHEQQRGESVGDPHEPSQTPGAAVPVTGAPRRTVRRRLAGGLSMLLLAAAAGSGGAALWSHFGPAGHRLTQKDIDAAVERTLQTASLPSQAARAAAVVAPSVVRVVGYGADKPTPTTKAFRKKGRDKGEKNDRADTGGSGAGGAEDQAADAAGEPKPDLASKDVELGVGTGVVIVDKGVILTNLHVVAGSERIKVTFADGFVSDAVVTGMQPENDLAVLQAKTVPDDLVPATMRSTGGLQPGDNVAVVGFPFGIGPSVSAGVVSGLKRAFESPQGKKPLSNLIQFDAAANPGNSGGPLVNMDGEVLGIVTAILNPSEQRTFIGIGFAVPIENAAGAIGSSPF